MVLPILLMPAVYDTDVPPYRYTYITNIYNSILGKTIAFAGVSLYNEGNSVKGDLGL